MYKTKPKVLEFVKLKLPFLPGKRKTKHTQLNYKQTIFVRNEISMKQHLLVERWRRNQSLPSHLRFTSIAICPYFIMIITTIFTLYKFPDLLTRLSAPKTLFQKKNYYIVQWNSSGKLPFKAVGRNDSSKHSKKNRCFIILVLFVFLPLCLFVLFKLILVQFFLIFLLILVVLTELIYANYIIIRIRLVSSVEQTQMRASNQGGRRIGCFDLN